MVLKKGSHRIVLIQMRRLKLLKLNFDLFVDQTVCFLIGLVMFFNLTNLDTKLVVAILGQDLAL